MASYNGYHSHQQEGMYDYPGSTPAPSYHAHQYASSSRQDLGYPEDDDHASQIHRRPPHFRTTSGSELAPDDSVSVVADRLAGVSRFHAASAAAGGGGWRYQDPYADPYAGSRRPPESQFSSATRRGEKGETIRRSVEDSPDWDDGTPEHHGGDGAFDSMANLPLVAGEGQKRRGPFDPLDDDDASTVVGSSYNHSKLRPASQRLEGNNSRDVLNAVPYQSLDDADVDPSTTARRSMQPPFDEETKYPPLVSPNESLADIQARRPPVWQRLFYDATPLEDKIELHKRGIGVQDRPWMCWIFTVGMVAGLIAELVRNWQEQGRPISTSPTFNFMIGPSSEIMINAGARFTPCIKNVPEISALQFPCLNVTSSTATCTTSLSEICGFGGFSNPSQTPDQTFRFILPIFLHAGIVHLALNLFVLLTSSAMVERLMGSLRFVVLFIPCGVFGFILGGNFSLVGLPSVGASGAIFGTQGAIVVDLVAHWKIEYRPWRKLAFLVVELIIGLGLGLIPGVDNFSHIGGFSYAVLLSIVLLPILHHTSRHRIIFVLLRLAALAGAIVMFVVLYRNFFTDNPSAGCGWCRYLSCWPTNANNHCKGTGIVTTTVNNRRSLPSSLALDLDNLPVLALAFAATPLFRTFRR